MIRPISETIVVPNDADKTVREHLGIPVNAKLKIAFVAGPGDLVGTYHHWKNEEHDPRIPVVTYSAMFFSLVVALKAEALILTEVDVPADMDSPHFHFVHTPRARYNRGIKWHLGEWHFSRKVAQHIREYLPDIVLIGADAPNWLLHMMPKNTKVILTAHNTFWPMGRQEHSLKDRIKLKAKEFTFRNIDAGVCTSEECARQAAALGVNPECLFVEVPQLYLPLADRLEMPATPRKLIYLGRIEYDKGVFDLLDTFKKAAADIPDATLTFAGRGTADTDLHNAISLENLNGRIQHVGLLSGAEVHGMLSRSDLLICPTRMAFNEGLALVVIEAAANGVPSLVSSVVPAQDLVAGACAIYPADDMEALEANLRQLLTDSSEYNRLCVSIKNKQTEFYDESQSWGSKLYKSILTLGKV